MPECDLTAYLIHIYLYIKQKNVTLMKQEKKKKISNKNL